MVPLSETESSIRFSAMRAAVPARGLEPEEAAVSAHPLEWGRESVLAEWAVPQERMGHRVRPQESEWGLREAHWSIAGWKPPSGNATGLE